MENQSRITRVGIRNYKSIERCDVHLDRLHFLVGPNGAGKSNFLDALRFIADALNNPLEFALRERGGILEVRKRSAGRPTHFGISLEFILPSGKSGKYAFRIGAVKPGGFEVQDETCSISSVTNDRPVFYSIKRGKITESSESTLLPTSLDRLYLGTASSLPAFRPVYDFLCGMSFYNLRPEIIRELQSPDQGDRLRRDGGNLASVISAMSKNNKQGYQRILSFLSHVLEGCVKVEAKSIQRKETLYFTQMIGSSQEPWRFYAENMSDGTLRALGVLTALFQAANEHDRRISLVGIEEPELAVHPFAAAVLRDALRVASEFVQVLVTSHSPDILDNNEISPDSILSVVIEGSGTQIAPLDSATRSLLRDRLFTAGELLRQNQLQPELPTTQPVVPDQLDLFEQAET
jgi:predicted ATPase